MPIEKFRPSFTLTQDRLQQLAAVVPEAFADGKVNWDTLKAALGEWVETGEVGEQFGLFWPGKNAARQMAGTPIKKTLLPAPGEGVNEADTHHLFIEGENLEALKVLYRSYVGKVKMIYIDPPYNTGNDFVYHDDFRETKREFLKQVGDVDEAGAALTSKYRQNTKASGRFHSNWLNMMLPRLMLARTLLTDDGVIFISINDTEQYNLRQMMNELFGEENFICNFVWVNEGNIDNQSRIKCNHEYIIMYAKNEKLYYAPPVIDPSVPKNSKLYRDNVENTIVKNGPANPITPVLLPIGFPASFEKGKIEPSKSENFWPKISNLIFVEDYKTKNEAVVTSGWSSRDIFERFIFNEFNSVFDTKGQESIFFITETGSIYTRKKRLDSQSHVLSILKGLGTVQAASSKLSEVGISFSYPKPFDLLKYLLQVGIVNNSSIVLDFFSGSCPLAEAVIELNREDGGNRRFIMVQMPETTPSDSAARQAGYKTIADIGKERIRRVIAKLQQNPVLERETPEDLGFRVFKVAPSHFKAWEPYTGDDVDDVEQQLKLLDSPLIDGWTADGLRVEVLLQHGLPLDSPAETLTADFPLNTVQRLTPADAPYRLLVCFDATLHPDTVRVLQQRLTPEDSLVCFDQAFADDNAKLHLAEVCHLQVI